MSNGTVYCPICGRDIIASNIQEVHSGADEGYIYVHDEINHEDSDLEALFLGVQ